MFYICNVLLSSVGLLTFKTNVVGPPPRPHPQCNCEKQVRLPSHGASYRTPPGIPQDPQDREGLGNRLSREEPQEPGLNVMGYPGGTKTEKF